LKLRNVFESAFVALQYLLPHHLLSRTLGRVAECRWPWVRIPLIRIFVRVFGVDLSEAREPDPQRYASFNDFFTRPLRAEARPLATDGILCPADGTLSRAGRIRGSDLFQAKGHAYSLLELLGDDPELASEFINGAFATIYLAPRDYHRVHMPLDGQLRCWTHVPGRLFSVNDTTARKVPRLFARNERVVSVFDTESGPMAVILVGAMIVAGIETVFAGRITPLARRVQHHRPNAGLRLRAGDELGRFLLGSTVIVLLPDGAARWQAGLDAGCAVRMGQALGERI
jgi:phosphatidylserine decarboxylase